MYNKTTDNLLLNGQRLECFPALITFIQHHTEGLVNATRQEKEINYINYEGRKRLY
jgi:hypothetical protein